MAYEGPIQELIDELARLPGVGPKSAQRLAFWLVKATRPRTRSGLAQAIVQAKERISFCRECGNVAEGDLCRICRDESRDRTLLCVVEEPKDAATIEKAALIKGRFHILGGAISPLDGIGPEDLRVQELLDRVDRDHVTEVILATNPNLEGNATAMYVAALLKPLGRAGHAAGQRAARRRRSRVRRRGDARAGARGPPRDVAVRPAQARADGRRDLRPDPGAVRVHAPGAIELVVEETGGEPRAPRTGGGRSGRDGCAGSSASR